MQLDNEKIAWKSRLSHLVSLLDMLKFIPEDFHSFMRDLEALADDRELFDFERPGLTDSEVERIEKIINKASTWCKMMEISDASRSIGYIQDSILTSGYGWLGKPYNLLGLGEIIKLLRDIIKQELRKRLFMYIPLDQAQWYDKKDGFGIEVSKAFPSAIEDIKEAGNCYATGRYTACVFHLMRVAEIGLRALVRDRRIKFPKDTPIELKEMRELFQALEQAEKDIKGYPKTKAREAQFDFYHGAMVQLRAFMNLYRHRTMHAREFYSQYRAQEALDSVGKFIKILASKISETKRTPLIWKKV